jgi:hypothetical protein
VCWLSLSRVVTESSCPMIKLGVVKEKRRVQVICGNKCSR